MSLALLWCELSNMAADQSENSNTLSTSNQKALIEAGTSKPRIANGDDFHRALFRDPQQSKRTYSIVWLVQNLANRGRQGRASQWLAFDPSDIFEGWEIFSKSWEYQLHHHTLLPQYLRVLSQYLQVLSRWIDPWARKSSHLHSIEFTIVGVGDQVYVYR